MSAPSAKPTATSMATAGLRERRSRRANPLKYFAWHAWLPALLVIIGIVVTATINNLYFPSLITVFQQTWERWFVDGLMLQDFLPSLARLLAGFGIALVVGILLGTLFGLIRPLEVAFRPLTEAARATPGAALLPIAMMFFATGETMKIVMIAFISMWPVLLNTIDGVRSVDPTLRSVMSSYRLSQWHRFLFAYLPQAAPQVFAGARISLAISISVMVIVEMFGTPGGIGYFIRHSQNTFKIVDMWTGLVILVLFGYIINFIFRVLEKRILSWHHRMVAHSQGD